MWYAHPHHPHNSLSISPSHAIDLNAIGFKFCNILASDMPRMERFAGLVLAFWSWYCTETVVKAIYSYFIVVAYYGVAWGNYTSVILAFSASPLDLFSCKRFAGDREMTGIMTYSFSIWQHIFKASSENWCMISKQTDAQWPDSLLWVKWLRSWDSPIH